MTRDQILKALYDFAKARPGLESANYVSPYDSRSNRIEGVKAYQADQRAILRDLHDARYLLAAVGRTSIEAADLLKVLGPDRRLTMVDGSLSYTAGQYYPTEYRAAVCSALKSALRAYFRDHCGCDTGDKIRAAAKRMLGATLAKRWFR